MGEVQALTQRLGLSPLSAIGHGSKPSGGSELGVLSGQNDIKAYGKALALAQEKTLPELFEAIKESNHELAKRMKIAWPAGKGPNLTFWD